MKLEVEAVDPPASVTVTETVEEPATVGAPEIVPVVVSKLRPLTKDPVNAYVRGADPPEPGTNKENALFAVPESPVEGVVIVNGEATVNTASPEKRETDIPFKILRTSTEYAPASAIATEPI